MSQSLEQQRAANAWECAMKAKPGDIDSYSKLAKGLPALIMSSGLMQTLAFLHEKYSKDARREGAEGQLANDLRKWLSRRYSKLGNGDFEPMMKALFVATPAEFQAYTAECYAWLRWVRQIAAAVNKGDMARTAG